MKTLINTLLLTVILTFATSISQAQIKVGGIKKPKVNMNKNSNSSKPTLNKYDKYMKEASEAESKGDYISAYKAYNNALKEKYNDYQAKSAQKNIEDKAEKQYRDQLNKYLDNEDCTSFKPMVDDLIATLSLSAQEKANWELTRDECEMILDERKEKQSSEKGNAEYANLSNGNYFSNSFNSKSFAGKHNVGDELWMNIKMGKTMMEYSEEFGIDETFNAYGYFVIYMDGKKVATTKPLHFSSNYSKKWTEFTVPVSINPELGQDKKALEKLMETSQGMWVVSNLQNADLLNRVYVLEAIKNMANKNGEHKLKIEFGLGEKGGKEPKGIITSGETTIIVDNTGKKELYKRGPKYLRPLDENEMGKITTNIDAFQLGKNSLTATVNLPNPPKYYAQKWCTTMSCNYDHGNMLVEVDIDGIEIYSGAELWNDKWESQKSFNFTIIPQNDNELDNDMASFNKEDLFIKDRTNKIVYGIIDLIYSGKIKAGNHKITIKFIHEVVVGNDRIGNIIAEQDYSLNINQNQITTLVSASNAKKLSHAGGSWTSVDNSLKSKYAGDRVYDVACNTEWKVTRNSLGVILYRTCKADVIYKTEDGGYRVMQSVEVKEDHNGSSYGKPFFTGMFRTDWGIKNLNSMHFPVPSAKIK